MNALPLDLTPTTIEKLSQRLPARTRAALSWFPVEFRSILIEPLRAAGIHDWQKVFKGVSVGATRIILRLSSVIAPFLQDPAFTDFLRDADPSTRYQQITARLERLDKAASDELLEAIEWMRVILASLLEDYSIDALEHLPEINDEQLRVELRSRFGSFIRGELLLLAVLESLSDERPLPDAIVEWCEVACQEMNSAANLLRAQGIPIPTKIDIPGFTAKQWRTRAHSLVLDALVPEELKLPPGVLKRIIEVLHPEEVWLFGSRARKTNRPDSDWDVLAVLPDDASDDALDIAAVWEKLRDILSWRVEVIPMRRREFEEERRSEGSLVAAVVREGYVVYGK